MELLIHYQPAQPHMFPYLTGDRKIGVKHLEILFEALGDALTAHHIVELLVGQRVGQIEEEKGDCETIVLPA